MEKQLQFDTSLSPWEIEQNFSGVDVFGGIMAGLKEALAHEKLAVRKPTGVRASNGEIHEGDLVRYEDGWLCFTARIVLQEGGFGFFLGDTFQELNAFLQDFPGAELDFEIIKEEP